MNAPRESCCVPLQSCVYSSGVRRLTMNSTKKCMNICACWRQFCRTRMTKEQAALARVAVRNTALLQETVEAYKPSRRRSLLAGFAIRIAYIIASPSICAVQLPRCALIAHPPQFLA